jgi:hypothetical protein
MGKHTEAQQRRWSIYSNSHNKYYEYISFACLCFKLPNTALVYFFLIVTFCCSPINHISVTKLTELMKLFFFFYEAKIIYIKFKYKILSYFNVKADDINCYC